MNKDDALFAYVLRLGDNALVLAQRLIELVTHGPELEEEMANANFSLDFLGQARMFYSLAGELEGKGRKEDDFAFMRDERAFCNFLLVEQPNGNFADTITRSVLFEEFYLAQLEAIAGCKEARLAEIAARAIKGIRYHRRHNATWLRRRRCFAICRRSWTWHHTSPPQTVETISSKPPSTLSAPWISSLTTPAF